MPLQQDGPSLALQCSGYIKHKREGHGIHLSCPITNKTIHQAESLFVNDTDLEHFDMNRLETVKEAKGALQESIHNWGWLLITTGGALKQAKRFYHLISFSWKTDGTWHYDTNERWLDLEILVLLEDGTFAPIEHFPITSAMKTLGQMTCPTRDSNSAIVQMQVKAQGKQTAWRAHHLFPGQAILAGGFLWYHQQYTMICCLCVAFEDPLKKKSGNWIGDFMELASLK